MLDTHIPDLDSLLSVIRKKGFKASILLIIWTAGNDRELSPLTSVVCVFVLGKAPPLLLLLLRFLIFGVCSYLAASRHCGFEAHL